MFLFTLTEDMRLFRERNKGEQGISSLTGGCSLRYQCSLENTLLLVRDG